MWYANAIRMHDIHWALKEIGCKSCGNFSSHYLPASLEFNLLRVLFVYLNMTCAPSETLFQLQMLNRSQTQARSAQQQEHQVGVAPADDVRHLLPVTLPPLRPPHIPSMGVDLRTYGSVSKKPRVFPRGRRTSPNSKLPCPVCHQLYSRRDNLRTHMRIHSKEKPYSCSECHGRFRWVGALRSHEAMHKRRESHIRQLNIKVPHTREGSLVFPVLYTGSSPSSIHEPAMEALATPMHSDFPLMHADLKFRSAHGSN